MRKDRIEVFRNRRRLCQVRIVAGNGERLFVSEEFSGISSVYHARRLARQRAAAYGLHYRDLTRSRHDR